MAYALFNKGCEGDGISLLKIAVDDDHLNSFLDKEVFNLSKEKNIDFNQVVNSLKKKKNTRNLYIKKLLS